MGRGRVGWGVEGKVRYTWGEVRLNFLSVGKVCRVEEYGSEDWDAMGRCLK